uniref:OB domain-containing protein n=1 Tax=Borrelia puertoricensis TaxID=2756107 RepID=A0AA51UQB5_9SPIR|nr:hypothetical protein MHINFGKF_00031 [Borrelia puertoricensis]
MNVLEDLAVKKDTTVKFAGSLNAVRVIRTKRNNARMAFGVIEDFKGEMDIIVFAENYEKYNHLLIEGDVIGVIGKLRFERDKFSIIVDKVLSIEEISVNNVNKINNLHLLGSRNDILEMVRVVDPNSFKDFNRYLDEYFSLQHNRELTLKQAREELLDEIAFSMMMVRLGEVKTCVCGALVSSSKVLRSVFKILPKLEETNFISSFMIMDTGNDLGRFETCFGYEGILMFADCAVIINPDALQLAEIAIQSANSFKNIFNAEPKVALLSFSTKGSANSLEVEKVKCALELVKSKCSDLLIDGELQIDAALVKGVAEKKCRC